MTLRTAATRTARRVAGAAPARDRDQVAVRLRRRTTPASFAIAYIGGT